MRRLNVLIREVGISWIFSVRNARKAASNRSLEYLNSFWGQKFTFFDKKAWTKVNQMAQYLFNGFCDAQLSEIAKNIRNMSSVNHF